MLLELLNMAGSCWKWLEKDGHGLNWLEIAVDG